jgi:CHAT domain-containing protein
LIVPIRSFLPTSPGALLTIIPHDVLNGVSFAALKDVNGRYLLEDFTLHYAPAGALFQFTSARRRADARTGSMLLVSDPTLPRRSPIDEPLSQLPGTRAESAMIAKYARGGGTTILQGSTASEQRIRELSADRSVLHFATHAIVREEDPLASELVLASSGGDSTQDGSLTAEEVYGMRLHADLVVLSACRSGAGAVPGEAMATFARAFLYAGTASLIASVWDVADEPTNQLVPSFYKEWFGGADKAVALRRAQLKLLDDLRAGRVRVSTSLGPVPLPEHPVFWAGFVLFGEPH